jgi:AmiR/NasT family two-component response regulator
MKRTSRPEVFKRFAPYAEAKPSGPTSRFTPDHQKRFETERKGSGEETMARLRVVLVEDGTFAHGSLRGPLESLDIDVVAEGAEWAALVDEAQARSADAFVVAAGRDPRMVYEMAAGDRAVIVVTDDLSDVAVAPAVERGAFGFAAFPLQGPLFHAQMRAAVSRAFEGARARAEANLLREQLETRKLVERAKGILMDRLGLTEQEAFRKLQRASQDENRKMRDIAESVVRAEKMFGVDMADVQPRDVDHARHARTAS